MFTRFYISAWSRLTALKDEKGQGMTEYALVLSLLAVGVIAAMGLLTGELQKWISGIVNTFPGTTPTTTG